MPRPRMHVFTALVVLMLAFVAFALRAQVTEDSAYVVARGRAAPIVDGVLDDPAWEGVKLQPIDRDLATGSFYGNLSDFEATFQAIWRDGNLFVAFVISDDDVFVDNGALDESDRFVIALPGADYRTQLEFVVPVFQTQSLEDPQIPFAAWSADGRVLEMSLETDAMFSIDGELLANFYFVDVDTGGPEQRIAWISFDPVLNEPQLGSLKFQRGVDPDTMLHTTWGSMKNLY